MEVLNDIFPIQLKLLYEKNTFETFKLMWNCKTTFWRVYYFQKNCLFNIQNIK